jgi:hypothetical protein
MCQELTFSACLHLLYSSLPSAPNELPVCGAIFVKKKDSGTYSDTEFGWWGVSYTNARKERFQTAVPVCILRKNFQNSVLAQKYPCWHVFHCKVDNVVSSSSRKRSAVLLMVTTG